MHPVYHSNEIKQPPSRWSNSTATAAGSSHRTPAVPMQALTNHFILDATFRAIEDPQILDPLTGEAWPFLTDAARLAWIGAGITPLEIDRAESEQLARLETSRTRLQVSRCVPKCLYKELEKQGLGGRLLEARVVTVPHPLLNGLICSHLLTLFSESDILSCPGFKKQLFPAQVTGEDDVYAVRLDLDPWLARQGIMMPVYDDDTGLMRSIKVYRYPKDGRPFILKNRGGEVHLNA